MFDKPFNKYACVGEKITCKKGGFTVEAAIHDDPDTGPPWKEHDGHGPVSEWRPKDSKQPGEKILVRDRATTCRFYNWQEAIKTAKADGWDAPPYGEGTPGQRAERAVQRDFDVLKAWCEDDWSWCGIVLSVFRNGEEVLEHAASLWGIELNYPDSDNGQLLEVANELLSEAIAAAELEVQTKIKNLSQPEED